jgi:iron complex transport system substrate-binding protein
MCWVFVLFIFSGDNRCLAESSTRIVADSLGRQVTIPAKIDRVISTCPTVTTIVYMLAPEKLLGWNFKQDSQYMPHQYQTLPVVGGWFGQQSGNYETIISMGPDVIFYETILDDPGGATLEAVQERQHKFGTIPVVAISGSGDISRMDEAIRLIGDILNAREKARELQNMHQEMRQTVSKRLEGLSSKERVRVYYAERPDGLSTDPSVSRHAALIGLCGGVNVADCALKEGMGMTRVSMEQVLQWNPEVIIAEHKTVHDTIRKSALWAGIEAVRKQRVHVAPCGPFCWFDRPPGASTIPGILWTAVKLHPARFKDVPLRDLTRRFYADFYHYPLTDQDLTQLLGPSGN